MDAMRDLSEVTRQSQVITIKVRGVVVTVSEVTMDNLPLFIKSCSPFLSAMDQLGEVKETRDEMGEPMPNASRKLEDKYGLFKLIGDNGPSFLDASSIVCAIEGFNGLPRDFLKRLRPDEFFHIALAVVEVNGDFFTLRLAPALTQFFRSVSLIGLSRTNGSSQMDIFDPSLEGTSTASSDATLPH